MQQNRLTGEQRKIIIRMLRKNPICSEVTRAYNAKVGPVTNATVCKIKNEAIAAGVPIIPVTHGLWWALRGEHTQEARAKISSLAALRAVTRRRIRGGTFGKEMRV